VQNLLENPPEMTVKRKLYHGRTRAVPECEKKGKMGFRGGDKASLENISGSQDEKTTLGKGDKASRKYIGHVRCSRNWRKDIYTTNHEEV